MDYGNDFVSKSNVAGSIRKEAIYKAIKAMEDMNSAFGLILDSLDIMADTIVGEESKKTSLLVKKSLDGIKDNFLSAINALKEFTGVVIENLDDMR